MSGLERTADVVVVGGGAHGCALAYNLCRLGGPGLKVSLFERAYLAGGATGRSAAGVRHQFGTDINCRLAVWNVRLLEGLKEELDYPYDLEWSQGGYLLLADTPGQLAQFSRNVALQRSLGIPSVILTPEQTAEVAPSLSLEGVLGASFCPRDGHVNPFHLTWAYARAARRLGARLHPYCEVQSVLVEGGRVRGVRTAAGTVQAPVVVVAAGAHGADLAREVGVEVPLYAERHQILVTEPVEHFLDPLVLCFGDGTYFKQTPHGSLLVGIGDPMEQKGYGQESTWRFLEAAARLIVRHLPALAGVRVVRQWAGLYDITPDSQAVVGPTPVEGLWLDLGWSGHGLQFCPSIGVILSQLILGLTPLVDVSPFRLARFETGELVPEPACI